MEFKLVDFNVISRSGGEEESDPNQFVIQMFGLNEQGETACIVVEEFTPFFYVKVGLDWGQTNKNAFQEWLKYKVGPQHAPSIVDCRLIERQKLYGFDNNMLHRFVQIKFANIECFNRAKNLWYEQKKYTATQVNNERKLKPVLFLGVHTELYEANIPPLLRFFHLRDISPSGWIQLPVKHAIRLVDKQTSCNYEYMISYKHIISMNQRETRVPYKIMSFDIEASSSHGDFPLPIKSHKKLAVDIANLILASEPTDVETTVKEAVRTAFGIDDTHIKSINSVFPKVTWNASQIDYATTHWLNRSIANEPVPTDVHVAHTIEEMFRPLADDNHEMESEEVEDEEDAIEEEVTTTTTFTKKPKSKMAGHSSNSMLALLTTLTPENRDSIVQEMVSSMSKFYPPLQGDQVTFIGASFLQYGDDEPYANHCIVMNNCDRMGIPNEHVRTCNTEKEVLLSFTELVQQEDPDIVIGYNIFSFDYEFMFRRSQELKCTEEFLKMSRIKDQVCGTLMPDGSYDIKRISSQFATGAYENSMIEMPGRMQVDMYNWFRKTDTSLGSYKLDAVASTTIGDEVKRLEHPHENVTRIYSNNLFGLTVDSFVHFEEFNHSNNNYKNGAKFKVVSMSKTEKWFEIHGHECPVGQTVKWGLAKDDITPKDIFRMTNEGPAARAIVAKYCLQDCNLVQYLMTKVDVITDLVEMAKLCTVPMSFLIFRGQGIKLTSFVAKKCMENKVLMPVIDKGSEEDAYEGAIVLDPKCGLYLKEAACVGDFASLYPSAILSENLCPSSKVWTKTYDLSGNLIEETGVKNKQGQFVFDNLPGRKYVTVSFDVYKNRFVSCKNETVSNGTKHETVSNGKKKIKERIGRRECCFIQPHTVDGVEKKAIMPSILQELLKARADTRDAMKHITDPFIKNVMNKRQLAYKVTANSLYGQMGATTSTIYEPDIASATTATGRLLLTFAKRVVEECYHDIVLSTSQGNVRVTCEYLYGDTDSVFFKFDLAHEDGTPIVGKDMLALSIEIAQRACRSVSNVLKQPHEFEYEKTFYPFCLLSKKRYVSMKYEFDVNKGKRDQMGIVLKRRDNAPIVKDIYGGVIDILMKDRDIQKAIKFVDNSVTELVNGNVNIQKLVISKSLRAYYKKTDPAHKMLADRIEEREPGNGPSPGDRVPYVYIVTNPPAKGKKVLQGNKIENPDYIIEHNLPIDYTFYITNQIMKPLQQLFGLVLTDIWLSNKPPLKTKVAKHNQEVAEINANTPEDKREKKIANLTAKKVKELIFDKHLRVTTNAKNKQKEITTFYKQNINISDPL